MLLSAEQRETLHKWLPTVLVIGAIWLLLRGLRKSFWMVFGLAWACHWTPGLLRSMTKLLTFWI